MTDTIAKIREALDGLITLKAYKDQYGKTPYYYENQPKVWEAAKQALSLLDELEKDMGGGAKTPETLVNPQGALTEKPDAVRQSAASVPCSEISVIEMDKIIASLERDWRPAYNCGELSVGEYHMTRKVITAIRPYLSQPVNHNLVAALKQADKDLAYYGGQSLNDSCRWRIKEVLDSLPEAKVVSLEVCGMALVNLKRRQCGIPPVTVEHMKSNKEFEIQLQEEITSAKAVLNALKEQGLEFDYE